MINSMTGYGEARIHVDEVSYRLEIRSLNNKYFKASIKLPELFQHLESDVEKLLRSRLGRGSITFSLRIKDESPAAAYELNRAALQQYISQLEPLTDGNGAVRIDIGQLLELPGVCQPPEADEATRNAQSELITKLSSEAIEKLIVMRQVEGKALLADLDTQCDILRRSLSEIRERSPKVVKDYHERLRGRVQELLHGGQIELDAEVLAREVAVFAERCDLNEEIARLGSHLEHFAELCAAPEESGRKLEFITQEMLREANTIGSKANDAEIARRIVMMKAAIDRIKEQVQNIE
ncbi:MAG: YicC family protein [Planctomycetota bacterium]|nr:YicC family protein [Planctomycetota bacterium]